MKNKKEDDIYKQWLQDKIADEFDDYEKTINGNKKFIERFQKKISRILDEIWSS